MASYKTSLLAIVDVAGRLKGTVTDHDIRVATLEGVPPETAVSKIECMKPVTIEAGATDKQLKDLLEKQGSVAAAVLEGGKFAGVRSLEGITTKGAVAVIMAGGRGQRLRPLTDKVPKPLLKVGSTSILERIIAAIASAGIDHVYMSVNYKAQVFEKKLGDGSRLGVKIDYLRETKKLDTAGSLSLLPAKPKGPILVTNADILTRLDFRRILEFHNTTRADATVAASQHLTPIPYGVLRTEGTRLVQIDEKPMIRVLCNAGIYVLSPAALSAVTKNQPLAMPDLLMKLQQSGRNVSVFPIIEKWFDIGSPEDFQKVLMEFATGEEE